MSNEIDRDGDECCDDDVRFLIEQGDMGFVPGGRFPAVLGNSLRAQIWRATIGSSEKTYRWVLRKQDEVRMPQIYSWKIRANWKRGKSMESANASKDGKALQRHMTKEQFINLYGGIAFANRNGVILNVHVIISWKLLGYEDQSEATKALQKGFLKTLTEWYYSKCPDGPPHVWVYSNECSGRIGFHTHLLTAIPNELRPEFREWVKTRLKKLSQAGSLMKGVHKIVAPPSHPIRRQWIFFQYICKGLDPAAKVKASVGDEEMVALADLIRFEYESPGVITCKNREGMSQNIEETARRKCGFQSLLDDGVVDIRRLYAGEEYAEWQRKQAIEKLKTWL